MTRSGDAARRRIPGRARPSAAAGRAAGSAAAAGAAAAGRVPAVRAVVARPGRRSPLLAAGLRDRRGCAPGSGSARWPARRSSCRCWPGPTCTPAAAVAAAGRAGDGLPRRCSAAPACWSGRWSPRWPWTGRCWSARCGRRRRRCATGPRSAGSRGAGWRSARATRRCCALAALGGAPLVTFAVALCGGLLAAAPRASPRGDRAALGARGAGSPGRSGRRGAGRRGRRRRRRRAGTAARADRPARRRRGRAGQRAPPRPGLQRAAPGGARQPRRRHHRRWPAEVAAGAGRRNPTWSSGRRTPATSTRCATPTPPPRSAAPPPRSARRSWSARSCSRPGQRRPQRRAGLGSPAPAGRRDRYIKRHPVPFAEYVPLRKIARMVSNEVDRVRRDFVAGDRPGRAHHGPGQGRRRDLLRGRLRRAWSATQ